MIQELTFVHRTSNVSGCNLTPQSGAVFIEAAISLGLLTFISFASLELITYLNQSLILQDALRRSAMSIQTIPLIPQNHSSSSTCDHAKLLIDDILTSSGIESSTFDITVSPATLGNSVIVDEPMVAALQLSVQSKTPSPLLALKPKASTITAMQQAIFQKVSEIECEN